MTLEGTNTYVVERGSVYVIDPGPAERSHLDRVRSAVTAEGGIAGILLTHSHADHSAGAPLLEAPLLFGEVGGGDEASGEAGAGPGAGSVAVAGERVGPFDVLPTPGHAPDHVCFLVGDVAFCGDLVLGRGSTFVPPAGGSLTAYLESLERLRAAAPRLLCPGHGPYVTEPSAKLDEYVEHRMMRERRLVAELDRGERSRSRLLEVVWDDVPGELRPAAAIVMQAHLEKLAAEGRLPDGLTD
jgi:glyoxylase-like metal-dependent hydrolase (beta-lactamase superfamily II)